MNECRVPGAECRVPGEAVAQHLALGIAYGSVVDNLTSDPTYVPAQK
jgi:hypothetical protein